MLACMLIILVENSLAYLEVSFIWDYKVSLQIFLPMESYNSAKIDVNCLQKHVNTIQGGQKIDEFSKIHTTYNTEWLSAEQI